ncbi:MAG: hypothetical protein DHS20C21_10490 [Gemmatimonadota bacterium]|nr:MAG: hypothetical protein DHS20C21_10490 [Gemmatimonadota bacterium]
MPQRSALGTIAAILASALFSPSDASELCFGWGLPWACDYEWTAGLNGVGYNTDSSAEPCGVDPDCYSSAMTFALSASSDDAYANTGGLAADGSLYLWLVCNFVAGGPGYGYEGGFMSFQGDLLPIDYAPITGGGHWDAAAQTLYLSNSGCETPRPWDPLLVGQLTVTAPTPVAATTWGRIKAVYR